MKRKEMLPKAKMLTEVLNVKMTMVESKALAELADKIEAEITSIEDTRKRVFKSYGVENEKQFNDVSKDDKKKLLEEFEALLDVDVPLTPVTIKLSEVKPIWIIGLKGYIDFV